MARAKSSLEDKRMVRDFLEGLAHTYPGGWEKLMSDAGVPYNTGQGWRYRTPRNMPSALPLLRILEAAGVLRASAMKALDAAAARAAEAASEASAAPPRARARPKRSASKK